ncbi:vegetative cell wall protein gp1 [Cocos nucifera]|uniref:Vegetative cell wall protein gp1 n=1 Tax=Cocos nucifera TaxID=13894 RepID=A0A8K0HXN8_COCNU|nr:vegetative cell wall protein gp1 [Cocos nucifera]
MTVTSNPPPSPSFPPSLQPSSTPSSNPWNRNPSGPLPAPLMGGSSSWPPLPSSSQIRTAVTATAVATVEQTPDETSSMEVIDPPSIPAAEPSSDPLPESTPEPDPLPESTPEPDPVPAQKPTAPSGEFDATPRPSAPRRRGPNHAAPNHHRGRNHRPQHGRGSRAPFFPGANGGNFNPPPAPNWNGGFGFGPMWPPHQPMGIPFGVPLPGVPPLNYYDVNLPPIPMRPPHYGGSIYPELNGAFYNFPLLPPGSLPLGAVPVGPHAPPPPPPMNLDQKAVLAPTPPPVPPMNEDQKPALRRTPPPPPSMTEDDKAVLLVELRKQIEYYFSDQNLVRDEYLKRQMDDEGWVDIHTIARFPKVAAKTADLKVIEEALASSDSVELQDNKLRKKDGWARYCIPKN